MGEVIDINYELGVKAERERIFDMLKAKGVLRESMLGDHMLVLYNAEGGIDISRKEFSGESEQG